MLRFFRVIMLIVFILGCGAVAIALAAPADPSTAVADTSPPAWGGTEKTVTMPEIQRLIIQFAPGTTLGQAVDLANRYGLKSFSYKDAPRADGGWALNYTFDLATSGGTVADYERFLWNAAAETNPAIEDCWTTNTCPGYPVWRAKYDPVSDAVAAALVKDPLVAQLANNNKPMPALFFWIKVVIALIQRQMTEPQLLQPPPRSPLDPIRPSVSTWIAL